jgi:hypothetical protein
MTISKYKGFTIVARPYQLRESRDWTAELTIRRNGRRQRFSAHPRYRTEPEADAYCAGLGRQIIDGAVPGWSVDQLRQAPRRTSAFTHFWKAESMRPYLIAGIVLLALGAFVLLRGASFTTRRDVVSVGDVKITADEQQSIPAWAGGAAVVAGAVLLVAGMRKRG